MGVQVENIEGQTKQLTSHLTGAREPSKAFEQGCRQAGLGENNSDGTGHFSFLFLSFTPPTPREVLCLREK